MGQPARTRELYEAIEALPDGVTGEIVDGRLYVHPRPAGPHALAAYALGSRLFNPFYESDNGPGGWWILPEPELHLDARRDVMVPDLAGWRRERMPALPEDQAFRVVPDWICEILSPSTESYDRHVKMPRYARHGVGHGWIIDPRAHRVETYVLADGDWTLFATFTDDQPIVAPPFDAAVLTPPWV
jgi:Uma2 family endonuclease